MTVNIGLVTSDALVLGCDSIASISQQYLDPFALEWETDDDGNLVRDDDGRVQLKFQISDLIHVTTSAWGGVTKMFQIHPDPSPVVAVTAGLAKLQGRTIASHAEEFFQRQKGRWADADAGEGGGGRLVNVEPICRAFLRFMRSRYSAHYRGSPLPEQFREGPEFLVGGFGRDDAFPSLYRVSVKRNTMESHFAGGHFGVSWNGQSEAVERFILGYDASLRQAVEARVLQAMEDHCVRAQAYASNLVNQVLDQLGAEMPEDIEIQPMEPAAVTLDWDGASVPTDYRNLPLQEAVNFAASLVMAQASRARFAMGVATVGGRIHIGVITKSRGFEALNEPQLVHRFTGLSQDV